MKAIEGRAPATKTEKDPGPIRTCLGCGKKQQKSLLHRLVLNERRQPVLDRTQRAPGRGAYLCGPGCLSAAMKRKAFRHALKMTAQDEPLDTTALEASLRTTS